MFQLFQNENLLFYQHSQSYVNLLANIDKLRKNESIIILSGLLATDRDDILNLVNKLNFNILAEQQQGEWICFIID